jgi:hypothetical protein
VLWPRNEFRKYMPRVFMRLCLYVNVRVHARIHRSGVVSDDI